jgi:serine/threonine protein kinase/tetratricopeptide (TPR) repeat protein
MNDHLSVDATQLGELADLLHHVDDFEKAWRSDTPPRIEDFLPPPDDPQALRQLLVELVKTDLEYRWRRAPEDQTQDQSSSSLPPRPRLEDYLARYPNLGPVDRLPVELIAEEYRVRHCWGDRPDAAEYRARFAGHPEALGEALEGIDDELAAERSAPADSRTILNWSPRGEPAPPRGPSPAPLQAVPGYEVLTVLGRGGMGVVYKARQTSLDRLVALKMISAGSKAQANELARFRREADAVARLQHPNTVQIYEIGEHDGLPYFVLEYVDGGSLARYLAGTPQPARPTAALLETLARAMHFAHRHGIVHRDLKPANVLLQRADGLVRMEPQALPSSNCDLQAAIPKITDFGLAKRLDQEEGQTQSGAIMGTPSYIAPEQAAGQSRTIGPAADVYALGAILYEMLTGRPPFRGETVVDTLMLVRTQDPVPPTRLQPKVPRDLETICLKCLNKEAGRRYPSAEALAEDLRRFQAGEPIWARPTSLWQRGVKWARRRPAVAGLLGALVLTVVVGFLGMALLWLQAEEARRDAVNSKERALENFQLAREAIDRYSIKVAQDPRLLKHDLEDLRKSLLQDAVAYYQKLGARADADATVQAERGRTLRLHGLLAQQLGRHQEAETALDQAVALFQQLAASHPEEVSYLHDLAECYFQQGALYRGLHRFDRTEQIWQQELALRQRLLEAYPGEPAYLNGLVATQQNLALMYQDDLGRLKPAEEAFRQALSLNQKLVDALPGRPEYRLNLAKVQLNLGRLYRDTGRRGPALESFRQAQAVLQGLIGANSDEPELLINLNVLHQNLGLLYHMTGQERLAELSYQEAVTVSQRLADTHPRVPDYQLALAMNQFNLGELYQSTGRPTQAERTLKQALALSEALVKTQPEVADNTHILAFICLLLGIVANDQDRPQEALQWCDQALRHVEAARRKNLPEAKAQEILVHAQGVRGVALARLGRPGEAVEAVRLALKQAKGQPIPELDTYQALVWAYAGDHAKATATAKAVSGQKELSARTWYDLGHVCALATAAVGRDLRLSVGDRRRLAESYAEQSLSFWEKARAGGCALSLSAVKSFLAEMSLLSQRLQDAGLKLLGELEKEAQRK